MTHPYKAGWRNGFVGCFLYVSPHKDKQGLRFWYKKGSAGETIKIAADQLKIVKDRKTAVKRSLQ